MAMQKLSATRRLLLGLSAAFAMSIGGCFYSNANITPSSVTVSGYTRQDGSRVPGYIRRPSGSKTHDRPFVLLRGLCMVVMIGSGIWIWITRRQLDSLKSSMQSIPTPPSPTQSQDLTHLFAPLGRTQRLYSAIKIRAWQLCERVRMIQGSTEGKYPGGKIHTEPGAGQLLSSCVAYSTVVMFLAQLTKDTAWAKSNDFLVVYGHTVLLMQVLLTGRQFDKGQFDKLDATELQKMGDNGDVKHWSAIAKAELGEMEIAMLHYMDSRGEIRAPDQQMVDIFLKKVATPEQVKSECYSILRDFMADARAEFANM